MTQTKRENAGDRYSPVGEVHTIGERAVKAQILAELPEGWRNLHEQGYIHIHDLDAYRTTYNCLAFDILKDFPDDRMAGQSDVRKVFILFNYLQQLFSDMGNEQAGGMSLANFDCDLAAILTRCGFVLTEENKEVIRAAVNGLIRWCSDTHTRMGKTGYFVTLNIGLADTELAQFLAYTLLDEFEACGSTVFKPNIVFKVAGGINRFPGDRNYELYRKALLCTAKKMIPTYLLCDSRSNRGIDPALNGIMCCRTRVVDDVYGENRAVGRGNVANITINLPRLALEIERDLPDADVPAKLDALYERWDALADVVKDILIDRYETLCRREPAQFPINAAHHLWVEDFSSVRSVIRHGTLSLGFIGLSEAMEVLTGRRFYEDPDTLQKAESFVWHMRAFCERLCEKYRLNFTLLATGGEMISGRFPEIDRTLFEGHGEIFAKGFYTNSFHVNVDSRVSAVRKIRIEGRFHEICNGGCITYVELGSAPLGNDLALREYVETAVAAGTYYLGFNFPKDVCRDCGAEGVFDTCPICGSSSITRIRRVSGYLEILDGFTSGKMNEEKARRCNGDEP